MLLAAFIGITVGYFLQPVYELFLSLHFMNISIPMAVPIVVLLTPQFMCWETCRAEFTSVFKKPLPIILTISSNWIISPLIGLLSANIFIPDNIFYRIGVSILFLGPSVSMVLYWNKIAYGSKYIVIGVTLLNTILILTVYPFIVFLLVEGIGAPVLLESVFFTLLIFFLTPFILGLILRYIFKNREVNRLSSRIHKAADKISLLAFFTFLIVLYIIQSRNIFSNFSDFIILAVPVLFGYLLVFAINLAVSFIARLGYEEMASVVIIGSGNQYELAVAASTIMFGVQSAVTFTVSIAPLLEAPIMILIIGILLKIYRLHGLDSSISNYKK